MPSYNKNQEKCRTMVLGPYSSGKTCLLELLPIAVVQSQAAEKSERPGFRIDDCEPDLIEQERAAFSNEDVHFSNLSVRELIIRGQNRLRHPAQTGTSGHISLCLRFTSTRDGRVRNIILLDHPGSDFFPRKNESQANADAADAAKNGRQYAINISRQCEALVICVPLTLDETDKAGRESLQDLEKEIEQVITGSSNLKRIVIAFTKAENFPDFRTSLVTNKMKSPRKQVNANQELKEIVDRFEYLSGLNLSKPELAITVTSALGSVSLSGDDRTANMSFVRDANELAAYTKYGPSYIWLRWQAINVWQLFHYVAFGEIEEGAVEKIVG